MKWYELLMALFGTQVNPAQARVWEDELRQMKTGNEEICETLRFIAGLDYTPRVDKERKTAKYNLRDLRLWVYIYRKNKREGDPVELPKNNDYRQILMSELRRLWINGRYVDAWTAIKNPELVPDVVKMRPPTFQDSEYILENAPEVFGYDLDVVYPHWLKAQEGGFIDLGAIAERFEARV